MIFFAITLLNLPSFKPNSAKHMFNNVSDYFFGEFTIAVLDDRVQTVRRRSD